MTACIGWETGQPCPQHGPFHGCIHDDTDRHGWHECECGERTRTHSKRKTKDKPMSSAKTSQRNT